jgi:hypothetical protein
MNLLKKYFLLILSIGAVTASMYFWTGSVEIKCVRLMPANVYCQMTESNLYGLIKNFPTIFTLSNVITKETKVCYYDGCSILDYRVLLDTSAGTFSLKSLKYTSFKDSDSFKEAEIEANKIRKYIYGEGLSSLKLSDNPNILSDVITTIFLGGFLLLFGWIVSTNSN